MVLAVKGHDTLVGQWIVEAEDGRDACVDQFVVVLRRNHAAADHEYVARTLVLQRLDQLFVDPTPEERILLEVEMEAAGLEAPSLAPRDQLDLFGGDPEIAPTGQRMDWTGIVRAMCESSADPAQSIEEYMRETARRVRAMTGIEIPDDDPEAFLKASARAGVLHIDR